ncbi:hypothetical protein CHUAL_007942 [Chamberlinius hualienensis]
MAGITRNNVSFLIILSRRFSTNISPINKPITKWESVIGLEIHAQISSKTKLFCGSKNCYGERVNTNVSYFDAGHPGTLPVLNKRCVEAGILTGLALNCTINKKSEFDRKHYFYSDLPVGYQITQQRLPLAVNGKLKFLTYDSLQPKMKPYELEVRIKQIQLEQDSGKSLHHQQSAVTFVDLNRAGVGLMEIIFEPELRTGTEAACLLNELKLILTKLGTCNCKMEEGSLRVDVNVSVNRPGEPLGTRTEIKNINSVRGVSLAIDYEINRQIESLEEGKAIESETMTFDYQQNKTIPMRDKEKVHDYRYMPEPNLPPLLLRDDSENVLKENDLINIDHLRRKLPKLPEQMRKDLMKSHQLPYEIANQLVSEDILLEGFYTLTKAGLPIKKILTFLLAHLVDSLNYHQIEVSQCPLKSASMLEIVQMEEDGLITKAMYLRLIKMIVCGDQRSPKQIVDDNNWYQITDEHEIEVLCKAVINENSELISSKNRKSSSIYNELVTIANQRSENRANMTLLTKIMKKLLC